MIQEIVNFVNGLPEEVYGYNIQPREGLYIFIELDEKGELLNIDEDGRINAEDFDLYSKKDGEISEVIQTGAKLYNKSLTLGPNKSYNSTQKIFISVGTPFGIGFKKQIFDKASIQKIEAAIAQYFSDTSAKSYLEDNNEEQLIANQALERFCNSKLFTFINELPAYKELKQTLEVFIFLKNLPEIWFEKAQDKYLSKRLWNDEKYSVPLGEETYGISDSISHFNDKKLFLKHHTATNRLNIRLNEANALSLYKFYRLIQNRQLPNPLPLFVDDKELTEKAVKLFNSSSEPLGYVELIKKLVTEKEEDLQKYYLFYFNTRAKKSKIIDIDFVPAFRFKIDKVKITEIFPLNGSQEARSIIANIFDFEYKIINEVFNRQLIPKESWRRYFDDIDSSKMTHNTYNQLLKYRKAIYNYVYKSQQQAITKSMFDDIMVKGIIDDIRQDTKQEKEFNIKYKLNIWFSLYEFFDQTQFNKPLKQKSMVNRTLELSQRMKDIAGRDNEHLENDEAFAFAAGQIIYFLLSKNESGSRTHSLLEPFIQKTDALLFKREIARAFDTYKHAITFYAQKYEFDKLMGEVMGYMPNESNMKNLLPYTLAGYFANNLFYSKKSSQNQ